MEKKKGALIAFHAVAITGILSGYAYLICQNKKQTKVNLNTLNKL